MGFHLHNDGPKTDIYELADELRDATNAFMCKRLGFSPKEASQYFSVEPYIDSDSIEVRAELDYDMMAELSEILDPIVQQADPDAYFDMIDSGIMEASFDPYTIEGSTAVKASYGGAWDIDPDSFWTRDDLNELADATIELMMNELNQYADPEFAPDVLQTSEIYLEDDNKTITMTVQVPYTGDEWTASNRIDMRKIRSPRDLAMRYAPIFADELLDQIFEEHL